MCLLCGDETAYRAYMDYLDAMERQGRTADPDEAMNAVLDRLQATDMAPADDPRNDRTLSPFFCSAVDK
ncbi:hypothetical protein NB311A_02421 [Nitrobacter sp. Nb-311A]|uniref:hypothetical protein n=1 Tax=unclassified Nitrobacter TaxID=2620411 RepID=UPI000068753B|nr:MULTISPECIES: hypothetical protein [unclassified Nitrobacter]EAQ34654.1 hypothetical protein NB311A_02421 [Nitrobacter sp. Nb-311A]MCB1391784.1 hypothetical protein [Nitrobacter sp.]MCV0386971.1 hypothetical protein [Nitrobacter sp.]